MDKDFSHLEAYKYDPYGVQGEEPVYKIGDRVIFHTNENWFGFQIGTVCHTSESRYRIYRILGIRRNAPCTWKKNEWELTCYNKNSEPITLAELVNNYEI